MRCPPRPARRTRSSVLERTMGMEALTGRCREPNAGVSQVQGRSPRVACSTVAGRAASIPAPVKPEKTFRLEEADAILPRLQILVERLQRGALRLHDEMSELARESGVAVADLAPEELVRRRPTARALVEELDGIVHEIEESG